MSLQNFEENAIHNVYAGVVLTLTNLDYLMFVTAIPNLHYTVKK